MLISIVTTTFNSEKTISRNVRSVISQSYLDFEHIVIDNLSTDNTLELIKTIYSEAGLENHLKIISEKDNGIAEAFNKGINAASGEIIGILNSDDAFFNNNVLNEIAGALSNRNKFFAHGDIYFADKLYGSNIRQPLKSKITGIVYNHPGMFIRKEVYSNIGLYNTDFRYSMDYEFYCRLKKEYKQPEEISVYIEKPLVKMNAGGASWENEISSIKEIKKALKLHKLFNFRGFIYYSGRMLRAGLKKLFAFFGMHSLIGYWRKFKWKS